MSGARGGRMNSMAQCVHTALIGGENFVCVSPAQSAQRNDACTPRGWENVQRAQQMRAQETGSTQREHCIYSKHVKTCEILA